MVVARHVVVGRDEELDCLRAFLADVHDGPAALVFSGEPGIGKTVLWEAGVETAERELGRVLSHRSVTAEALLSFAGLSDLLSPVLDELAPTLAPLRRRALEVALLLAEPGDQPPDPRAIGLALLDVLRTLAERGPLLIALDDAQWLDRSSAAVLHMALRRLRDERIGLLATLRKEPGTAAPFELETAFPEERLRRVWLAPLSLAALHHVLRERLQLELTRPELARVRETSGGNPFFALELGRELSCRETPAAGEALRVPDSLQQLLGGRLARLPAATVEVLLTVAALARPTVELVLASHEDPDEALDALDSAVREGLIEMDGSGVRFSHPLLGSLCYEQAPLRSRRGVHRKLAGAVGDVEERARHLAHAAEAPDRSVAGALRVAAEHAASRGATAAAAELCELAAELTPPEDGGERRRALIDAAEFHRLAGEGERAAAMLERLLAEAEPGPERADVLFGLVRTLRGDATTMLHLCDKALEEAPGDDVRAALILAHRMGVDLWRGDVRAALLDARTALEKAERLGDPSLLAAAISRTGTAEAYAAEITPGLLERGAELEERHGLVLEYHNSPRYQLARFRMRMGETDRPRSVLEDLEAKAAARGDESSRVMVLSTLSMLEWLAGRWQRALELTREAHELTGQTQHPHAMAWIGRTKALIEADLGLVEEARASATECLAHTRSSGNLFFTLQALGTLGRLELALGNLEAAGDLLREIPGELLAGGYKDPTIPLWPDALETLIALGEVDRARAYLADYEVNAHRFGSPWALAAAARSRGALAAAEGRLGAAFDAYDVSFAQLEPVRWPFESARSLLCLGSARRQAKQKGLARDALEGALATFEELGAGLWAERAAAELRRISGRRRASDEELTEMEERVAELAAAGHSNKAIAAELFVSVHTVGSHLSRAYQKLGIQSRAGLAKRFANPASEPAKVRNGAAKPPNEAAKQ